MHISIFLYAYAHNFFSVSNQEVEGTVIGYIYIYTQRKKLSTPCFFEMTNDTTNITRLLTR